jgi:hypothetical protein
MPRPSLLFTLPLGAMIWSRPVLWKGGFEGYGRGPSILWGNCGVASPAARGARLPRRGVAGYFGRRDFLNRNAKGCVPYFDINV